MNVKQRISEFILTDLATRLVIRNAALHTFDEFDLLLECGVITDEGYVAFIIDYFKGFDYGFN